MEPKEPPFVPNYEPLIQLLAEIIVNAEQEEAARKLGEAQATDCATPIAQEGESAGGVCCHRSAGPNGEQP